MDLSILIPARNEMWLSKTIEDIVTHMEGDTEVIATCDGNWPEPPIKDHPRVNLIYHSQSIGQRAATNEAARYSQAKYLMKCDAHCAFDQGFDVKLLRDMQDDWTMVPTMRNLHIFDWICDNCKHRKYQGPTPEKCEKCGGKMQRDVVWNPKRNPQSNSYCFDPTPHFQYFREFSTRPEGKGDLTETMSLQGSCFLMTRERYHALNICDETFGSWGSQGIEVACKTWLSGGRVVVNHRTWYGHCFRTQGGDFGFPYEISGRQTEAAKQYAKKLFFENRWEQQIYPLSWLVEKFWPVPGWTDEDLKTIKEFDVAITQSPTVSKQPKPDLSIGLEQPTKGIVYYTDSQLDETIASVVQKQISKCCNGYQIVSVSLQPMTWGDNITLDAERGILTMFKQILAGLERSTADVVFLCEHDVLYHPSHFEFTPARRDIYYYNENTYKVDADTGQAVFYYTKQTSGLCAYRELLLRHYRARVARVEAEGFKRFNGFEPGTHILPRGYCNNKAERWMSAVPNIDIRHGKTLTASRWEQSQFRSQKSCQGWTLTDQVPGWGITKGRFSELLQQVAAN